MGKLKKTALAAGITVLLMGAAAEIEEHTSELQSLR